MFCAATTPGSSKPLRSAFTLFRLMRRMIHCFAYLLLFTAFALAGFAQTFNCAPSDPGVRICSPDLNAPLLGSVATIIAGATAQSGNITAVRAYIDDKPVFTTFNPSSTNTLQAAQDVNVDEGLHHLVIVAYQDAGDDLVNDLYFRALTATYTNCIPTQPGATFCHPALGRVQYPVQISAGATALNGYITALRLYVDDEPQLTVYNPQESRSFAINEPLAVPHDQSPHTIVLVGYESTGGAVTVTQTQQEMGFFPPELCPAPDAPGVNVCRPKGCSTSGVYSFLATGRGASGSVDHMELWADGNKLAEFPGSSINTNIGPPLLGGGPIAITFIEVDSNGDPIASNPFIISAC